MACTQYQGDSATSATRIHPNIGRGVCSPKTGESGLKPSFYGVNGRFSAIHCDTLRYIVAFVALIPLALQGLHTPIGCSLCSPVSRKNLTPDSIFPFNDTPGGVPKEKSRNGMMRGAGRCVAWGPPSLRSRIRESNYGGASNGL